MSRSVSRSMGEPKQTRRSLRLSALVWLLGLGACTSVLGIEDLHDSARPGTAGDGTGATESGSGSGSGGKGNSGGKSAGGGTTANTAGTGNDAGAGNEPTGGTAAMAGTTSTGGTGNDAGAGGATEPAAGPVTGKVIDRWGVPVANVTVQVGADQVLTDDQGVFTVPNVTATYDVSLLIDTNGDGWVYEGLTRRNPTLQVFQGHRSRSNYVALTLTGATLLTNEQLSLAVGTPTGSVENADSGIDSPSMYPEWEGGTTTQSTFHGLKWLKNATTHLPVTYKAYDSKPLALTDSVDGAVALNLAVQSITGTAITGTVTPLPPADESTDGSRTNSMFVRFSSGASIQVVDDTPPANTFSYIAPTLTAATDSTMTVAAWEGSYAGPMGLVHKDNLKPGADAGTLKIPAPPTVTALAQNTGIDETTMFSFKSSADNAGAFLVVFHSEDTDRVLYIVTTRKKLSIASLAGSQVFEHATADPPVTYGWWIETHGHFATVDDMTGTNGYVDEFSRYYTTPVALHQADGTYTFSAYYTFTTKNQ